MQELYLRCFVIAPDATPAAMETRRAAKEAKRKPIVSVQQKRHPRSLRFLLIPEVDLSKS